MLAAATRRNIEASAVHFCSPRTKTLLLLSNDRFQAPSSSLQSPLNNGLKEGQHDIFPASLIGLVAYIQQIHVVIFYEVAQVCEDSWAIIFVCMRVLPCVLVNLWEGVDALDALEILHICRGEIYHHRHRALHREGLIERADLGDVCVQAQEGVTTAWYVNPFTVSR